MKKFLFIVVAAFLLMPVTSAFANPNAEANTNYMYLLPQEDGTVLVINKFVGVKQAGVVFDVPTNATNLKVVAGSELKDGKVISLAPTEAGKIEYHYNIVMTNGEFNYVTPVENTSLTIMTPEGKGIVSSKEIELETDTSGAGDFNMDGLNDYFFAAFISEANKPVKLVYDQSAKAPKPAVNEEQNTEQNNAQDDETKVTPAEPDNTTLYIVLGTLGVVLVAGAGLFFYFRGQNKNRNNSDSSSDESEDDFVQLAQQRKDILSKISELQENLEAGLITEEEQLEKEKVLREKLLKITVKIKEFTE
ncbi:MAG: hypothetical protein K0R71_1979 [Bacillales bacterium]|jgi:hypothetical protein|nr:hypothetical protein [Bacillales bacterium]